MASKPTVTMPKSSGTSSGAATGSVDEKLLDALMQHVLKQEEVPANLQAMVAQYSVENTRVESKHLHLQVKRQTDAKEAMAKLAQDRMNYDIAWSKYLSSLTTTFQAQLEERQATLNAFAEAEEAWGQQLAEATSLLSKSAGPLEDASRGEPMEAEDDEDATIAEAAAAASRRRVNQEKAELQQQQLLQAMKDARDLAQASVKERDGSRAPRRARGQVVEVPSSPEVPRKAC